MSWEMWHWGVNHCCVLVSREVNICHFVLCTSHLTLHISHILLHTSFTTTSHLTPQSHTSHLFFTLCTSLLTPRPIFPSCGSLTSHFTPPTLTPHSSNLTSDTSQNINTQIFIFSASPYLCRRRPAKLNASV